MTHTVNGTTITDHHVIPRRDGSIITDDDYIETYDQYAVHGADITVANSPVHRESSTECFLRHSNPPVHIYQATSIV